MATIYRVDGSVETMTPPTGGFTLDEVYGIVGGYVELIRLRHGFLLVDEEGRFKELPFNPYASVLAGRQIVGTALHITNGKEFQ